MAYIGVNDKARAVKELYIGVNGYARKVKKAYVGDANGVARLWWGEAGGNYPVLKPSYTWYQSTRPREEILTITIVNSYAPTGNEDESWAADVDDTGAITCYRTGTDVIVAGNGSGGIAANPDSSLVFYGCNFTSTVTPEYPNNIANYFTNLQAINGLHYLDTSEVTNMYEMFHAIDVTTLDVSSFDTSNVTNMSNMFSGCVNLTSLDLTSFDTSKVTNMYMMFAETHELTTIQVTSGKWVITTGADTNYMFYKSGVSAVTYV